MKTKLFFLFFIGLGSLQAQPPTDYVYQASKTYEFTGSNFVNLGPSADFEPGLGDFTVMFSMIAKKLLDLFRPLLAKETLRARM